LSFQSPIRVKSLAHYCIIPNKGTNFQIDCLHLLLRPFYKICEFSLERLDKSLSFTIGVSNLKWPSDVINGWPPRHISRVLIEDPPRMDEAQLDRAVDHSNDNNVMTYLDADRRTIRHDGNTDFRIHRSGVQTIPKSHSYISTFRRSSLPRSSSSSLTRTLVRSSIRRSSNLHCLKIIGTMFLSSSHSKLTDNVLELSYHWPIL